MAVEHPVWGTMCAICFKQLKIEDCVEDINGQKWDVCKGPCAKEAEITERVKMSDWTTKKISDDLEIDLHYDLLSFPAILKSEAYGRIVMSDSEVRKLYSILTEYYKEEYGNEMAPKNS